MPSNHLILCRPLFLLPSIFPRIRVFFNESALHIRFCWSTGASASASVLPMNIQGWFPLGLTGLISLLSKRLSRVFSSTTTWKHQFFGTQPYLSSNFHIHTWLLERPKLWLYGPLSAKLMSLLFNMLSRFVIALKWIEIWWSRLVNDNDQIQVAALHMPLVLFFSLFDVL